MKLSKNTLDVLKNFSTINSNLFVNQESTLLTMSPNKSIMAQAKVPEVFPQEFGIFNLSEFLGVISLFKDPEIDFDEKCLYVAEGKNRVRYVFAAPELLTYPKSAVKMPECEIEFSLCDEDLAQILKTSGVISAPDVEFRGENGIITAVIQDASNEYSNQLTVDLGATTTSEFNVFIKVENLKVVPATYTVSISSKNILQFKNADGQTYWVAAEANSEVR